MRPQNRTREQELARIAFSQHGVVKRGQLLEAGFSGASIQRRVRRGSLLLVHPGVYRVGHRAPSIEARYLAAVLACGDGALLGGRAAGYLLGLLKGTPPDPEVVTSTERRVEGVQTRRSRRIDPRDATVCRGISVTTVPRTLVDLAAVQCGDDLARACHEAGVRYRTTPADVEAVLRRLGRVSGAPKLRDVLHGATPALLSKTEKHFRHLLELDGLDIPIFNRPAGSKRVDCRWPKHRLTVELDSFTYHNSRYSWEQDRRREREAHARGDEFRRYTYGDVFENSRPMFRELRRLLGRDPDGPFPPNFP